MKYDTYKLYFGVGLSVQKPTTITIKARTQKEADKKAHKIIHEAELYGNFSVKKEAL